MKKFISAIAMTAVLLASVAVGYAGVITARQLNPGQSLNLPITW